jgi:uncharacterized protein
VNAPTGPERVIVAIRVSPAASRTLVGGRRGASLVVRVTEAAVDGRATEAALRALAAALGIRPRDLSLRSGAASREKLVEVVDRGVGIPARVAALLDAQTG